MLTEAQTELIAAAVDGELTPTQDADLHRLIQDVPEADALLQRLLADRMRLRTLKRVAAPSGLTAHVLARLNILPTVEPRKPASKKHRSPNWLAHAVAASLFLTVAAGACWLSLRDGRRADSLAQKERLPNAVEAASNRPTYPVPAPREVASDSIPAPRGVEQIPDPRVTTPGVEVASAIESAPAPRTLGVGELVASPTVADLRPFETIQIRLPYLVPMNDFDQPEGRKKLLAELGRDPAFRLDLFSRDPQRAAEMLQAAAGAVKLNLIVDAVAQDRLAKKTPSAWVVYTETLTATDIAALLAQLATVNRADKSGPIGTAHLIPAQQSEQREVRDLIGVDPGLWKRPQPATEPKPISSNTADQVASNLLKTNGERTALLLTYLPLNGRANPVLSKEVKTFLDRRATRAANAVPLIVVIRPAV